MWNRVSMPDQPTVEQPVNLWPDPPPKRGGGRAVVISIVALVVVLGGGATAYLLSRPGGGEPEAAASPTRATARAPAALTPSPSPTLSPTPKFTPYAGKVDDLVMPVPAGATPARLTSITSDMSDEAQAEVVWGLVDSSAMLRTLENARFVAGGVRVWLQGPDNKDLVIDNVLEFPSPENAAYWQSQVRDSLETNSSQVITSGPLLGVGGPTDFRWVELNLFTEYDLFAVFVRGQFGVLIRTGHGDANPNQQALFDAAKAQYQMLPAGS
jgi:hypothetical protein